MACCNSMSVRHTCTKACMKVGTRRVARAAECATLPRQVWLVCGDCLLIGLAPVLVHMSKVDGAFPFHPVSLNLLVELAKMLFAAAVLGVHVRPGPPRVAVAVRQCMQCAQCLPGRSALEACMYGAAGLHLSFSAY